jgi:hypothetical protein
MHASLRVVVFTNVCHHYRQQGKRLLLTDSAVNIGHSVLAFLPKATVYVNILYVFNLKRMSCVCAVYCLIFRLIFFPGKQM